MFRRISILLAATGLICASVQADPPASLTLTNNSLRLELDFQGRCVVSGVWANGLRVSKIGTAAYTGIMVSNTWYTSCSNQSGLKVETLGDTVVISGIRLGPKSFEVQETWILGRDENGKIISGEELRRGKPGASAPALTWQIVRRYPAAGVVQDSVFPSFSFEGMSTWTGALLDTGGVAWNRYLDTPGATYGIEGKSFICWNPTSDLALSIEAQETGNRLKELADAGQNSAESSTTASPFIAHTRFTHEKDESQTAAFSIVASALKPKHDLRRYHPTSSDIWAPFQVKASTVSANFSLRAFAYKDAYNLGELPGVSEESIRQMLHTIGRYGVVDRKIVGANGWRTGFKCLHEQWFSQIGIALQDPDYIANCAETFDFERDHALRPDGRLKSRWWWVGGDAIPGSWDSLGYYEAQWGMLMDSQTCFPICVAELFDLTGDRNWLASHKKGCERMLDYLLRRDADGDGLVEMHNALHSDGRGSDWIDVIWAAHENALVNAELYYALLRWSELERLLGDRVTAIRFEAAAQKLKASFNQDIAEGGFWNPKQRWFVYWRDKDDSIHGDNLVTPVQFAAIAYGVCDDPERERSILGGIEQKMLQEKLFYWPLSFLPYAPGEGHSQVNYPFPKYENGDIFLSWGELAVRAYARTQPDIAMKYIRNTLKQYNIDGLSFQRYERESQRGVGEDILAGNCMPVVGLYRDIYGIQPKHNRLFLEPHITPELDGTVLNYSLRGQDWQIRLSKKGNRMESANFSVSSKEPFAMNVSGRQMTFFAGTNAEPSLLFQRESNDQLDLEIVAWKQKPGARCEWKVSFPGKTVKVTQRIAGLNPGKSYKLTFNGERAARVTAGADGELKMTTTVDGGTQMSLEED